jgi:transposase
LLEGPGDSVEAGCDAAPVFEATEHTVLVPNQDTTGGKDRLGSIAKQGNRYVRWLLVSGAIAVIRHA